MRRRRLRRLPGWWGRLRPKRYTALRSVWHPYFGYRFMSLNRRPTDRDVQQAEYAWQMGELAAGYMPEGVQKALRKRRAATAGG